MEWAETEELACFGIPIVRYGDEFARILEGDPYGQDDVHSVLFEQFGVAEGMLEIVDGTVLGVVLRIVGVLLGYRGTVPTRVVLPVPTDLFLRAVLHLNHDGAVPEAEHDVRLALVAGVALAGMLHQPVEQRILSGLEQQVDVAVPLGDVQRKAVGVCDLVL